MKKKKVETIKDKINEQKEEKQFTIKLIENIEELTKESTKNKAAKKLLKSIELDSVLQKIIFNDVKKEENDKFQSMKNNAFTINPKKKSTTTTLKNLAANNQKIEKKKQRRKNYLVQDIEQDISINQNQSGVRLYDKGQN